MPELKIVYMGTPQFSVPCLRMLHQQFQVVAVVTAPDRAAGRGLSLNVSPVKEAALTLGIPVLQPTNLKSVDFLQALSELQANIFVVVAFRMLPHAVWSMPNLGTINLHGSYLPAYRGAAPINWAIIKGEQHTGLTTFKLRQEIDTGDILLQHHIEIAPDDTAGSLHDKMMTVGPYLLEATLDALVRGSLEPIAQVKTDADPEAPKLTKENTQIDWTQGSMSIYNFIRGLAPYPSAYTIMGNTILKVANSQVTHCNEVHTQPGRIAIGKRGELYVGTGDGSLRLHEIKPEGKKLMSDTDYTNGLRNKPERFG